MPCMGYSHLPTPHDSSRSRPPSERRQVSLRQLAHELNSLLDGSIRCVDLARGLLDDARRDEPASVENAMRKLTLAQETMRHMAELLSRAMRSDGDVLELLTSTEPIDASVRRILTTLQPIADEAAITLDCALSPEAANLPIGPLEPVLLNGLRNAIEACAMEKGAARCVDMAVSVNDRRELVLIISDTGPGLPDDSAGPADEKPSGHGIGLDLSRRIVEALDGQLDLMNVPFGHGAVLKVRVHTSKLGSQ